MLQVGTALVGSVGLFLGLIVLEIVRAVRFSRRVNVILRQPNHAAVAVAKATAATSSGVNPADSGTKISS